MGYPGDRRDPEAAPTPARVGLGPAMGVEWSPSTVVDERSGEGRVGRAMREAPDPDPAATAAAVAAVAVARALACIAAERKVAR